jgi:serine/threonine protein kinase
VRIIASKCAKATVMEKHILVHLAESETEFIVKLHASFQDERHLYLLMDFIEGESLRNCLNKGL